MKKKNKFHIIFIVLYLIIILYTVTPILSLLVSNVGASLSGCPEHLQGGSLLQCPHADLWYSMGVFMWAAVITIPSGIVVLFIVFIIHLIMTLIKSNKNQEMRRKIQENKINN